MTRFVDHYLAALLAQASHLISSEFHTVVRANGLSVSEWRVLASLAVASCPSSSARRAAMAAKHAVMLGRVVRGKLAAAHSLV